ncbi:thermonuclease family protein [Tautonia plasticadhaerens]|uniref:Endonuclease YhcR n=1 Tax=Tautonia plasticadhaerens TaxID=2527974 RepID=A0A518H685_9BACT|nr:thermonuclease family protein [Tautonia plasticadhaerens]QDV36343.1 Endonuclease YhcR precursor [Tautonia plasticadhaerens]
MLLRPQGPAAVRDGPAPADFSARVVGISDGDTLTVLVEGNRQVKVRLHGIDTPETGRDFGTRARQASSELAFGKTVTIRDRDTDRYGRTVAEVILSDGTSLNRTLVAQGYTWWYRTYTPTDTELERLEAGAKAAKRGLWARPDPVAPWDWRRGERGPAVGGSQPAIPALSGGVISNRNSRVYHASHCRSIGKMKEGNKVPFSTAAEAQAAGYRKAGDCD